MEKHLPLRKCVACGGHFPKADLYKIVKNNSGFIIDTAQRAQGRGAYVCKGGECILRARVKRQLDRSFRCGVPEEIYKALSELSEGGE